jgi:peptide-methionine (S)-S-oxide reductase
MKLFLMLGLLNAPASPPAAALDTAYFAGGCFWGVEAVFEHVRGVQNVVSGYSGGRTRHPTYDQVTDGNTGHAESVRVVYDPAQVTYETLLRVFFVVAHDPTQLNRQGPDVGTQYRSMIFYRTPEQQSAAKTFIAQLASARTYAGRIVTELVPLEAWYDAESYHQDFAAKNPRHPYIVYHDAPKVAHLKRDFATLYRER